MADEFKVYAGYTLMTTFNEPYYSGPRSPDAVATEVRRSVDVSLSDLNGSMSDFADWYTAIVAQVPAEYMDQARVEFEDGDDYGGASCEIYWTEPRPQAEIDADIERALAWQQQEEVRKEHQQSQQYEALKAKFEGKDSKSMLNGLTSNSTPDDKFTLGVNTKGDLIATHWNPNSFGGPVNSFNITEYIRTVVAEELAKAK